MEKDVCLLCLFILTLLVPSSLCTGETIYALNGQNARIPCGLDNIAVSPESPDNENNEHFKHISWTLPHMTLLDHRHVEQENSGLALIIRLITPAYNGLYTCQVDQFSHKFHLKVVEISRPLFHQFRIGLPIAECDIDRRTKYEVGIGRAFCQPPGKSCWAGMKYIGCSNDELYEVEITPRITAGHTMDATKSLDKLLKEIVSDINGHFNSTKQNVMDFLQHADFPVDVSKYSAYPKWYIDFFFGGNIYEKERKAIAEKVINTLPDTISPTDTKKACSDGYSRDASLFCLPCPPGHHGNGSACLRCPSGAYQDMYAEGACKPCSGVVSQSQSQCSTDTTTQSTGGTITAIPKTTLNNEEFPKESLHAENVVLGAYVHNTTSSNTTKTPDGRNYYYKKPKPSRKGTNRSAYEVNSSHKDPTRYILIGVLLLLVGLFVALCVVRYRREKESGKAYLKMTGDKSHREPETTQGRGQAASDAVKSENVAWQPKQRTDKTSAREQRVTFTPRKVKADRQDGMSSNKEAVVDIEDERDWIRALKRQGGILHSN